jgi:hypothetical protein
MSWPGPRLLHLTPVMLGLVKNHTVSSLIGRSLFAFGHLILGTAVEISGLLSCFQLSVNMSQVLPSHWGNFLNPAGGVQYM